MESINFECLTAEDRLATVLFTIQVREEHARHFCRVKIKDNL